MISLHDSIKPAGLVYGITQAASDWTTTKKSYKNLQESSAEENSFVRWRQIVEPRNSNGKLSQLFGRLIKG